jgi:DNA-binding NarL/FixJ family response regulator
MTSSTAPAPPAVRKSFILIVDDHPLVRHGLASLIGPQSDLAVCGEAATPAEALSAIQRLRPDLAIVDLSLGDDDGLDLVKTIAARHRDVPVLICSMHKESAYAERALRAGARGYVMKQEPDEVLLAAVRRVLSGQIHVSEAVASRMLLKLVNPRAASGPSVDQLSDREYEVFRLIGRGVGPSDIARQLGVSVKTIETHREGIKRKLNLASAHDLLRAAMRHADDGTTAV